MTPQPASATSLFIERIIRFLLPYFTAISPDLDLARQEIMETLTSYGARTRSEMLNAAQTIALGGFAALDALREASAADMPAPLRLRFLGCANNLNRSCRLNEKALARQQAGDVQVAKPTAIPVAKPAAIPVADLAADPVDNLADAETEAVILQAQAAIQARCATGRSVAAPPAVTDTTKHNRVWGGAMMDALAAMGMPVQLVPATPTAPG
jgi:hypothetical protein